MKMLKNLFPYFVIFGSLSFTIITTLVGYRYTENSSIYRYYNIFIAVFAYLITICMSLRREYTYNPVGIIIALIFTFGYLMSCLFFNNESKLAFNMWTYYLIWSLPAFLFGMVISRDESFIGGLWKTVDFLMLIISVVVIVNGVDFLLNGRKSYSTSGTVTYQTLSYLSAFAFGLNYFLLLNNKNPGRIRFFRENKIYRMFCLLLLLVQGVSLVVTGGRGGFILLAIYFLYITFFIKGEGGNYIKYISIAIMAISTIIIVGSENPTIKNGLKRIFSYITNNGIDMSETSYRDVNYKMALDLINQRVATGYGIYGLFMYTFYPHNLFLEILLGGGLLYFFIFILAIFCITRKYGKMIQNDKSLLLLLIFLLYDLVMLMFSGSYLNASVLWFFVGFVINYDLDNDLKMCRMD